MQLRILHRDRHVVAIDKPAGFFVHPSEDPSIRVPKRLNCLSILRDQIGAYLYPIHRIDRATSGVVLFALTEDASRALSEQFRNHRVRKRYILVARGWLKEKQGRIERPLKNLDRLASTGACEPQDSRTDYETLSEAEWPFATDRYPRSRYTLAFASPITGRTHQIRRHFGGLGHPLVGDTRHGDRAHNRIFKDQIGIAGLMLKALTLEFAHPATGERVKVRSKYEDRWHRLFDRFGVCPRP